MTKFKIFRKSAKFFWSRSRILMISSVAILILIVLKLNFIEQSENDFFEKYSSWALCGLMILGIINTFRREQLKGKLEGEIVLDFESITVEERKIKLEEIRLIKFEICDYQDKLSGAYSSYDEIFSAGVDNKIIIILNTGEVVVRYFQLIDERGMLRALKELNHYYNQKKMLKRDYDLIFT